jgi:hypothetical protein
MSNKIVEIAGRGQFTPQDAAEWFLKQCKEGKMERVLILYKEDSHPLMSFVQGSVHGNYTVADVNWDVDQFKRLHLAGQYEPVED